MRLLQTMLAGAIGALQFGCASSDWRSAQGPDHNWREAYLSPIAYFTLDTGDVRQLNDPEDYGTAVCAYEMGCISKPRIVSVRWHTDIREQRSEREVLAARLFPFTTMANVAERQPLLTPASIDLMSVQGACEGAPETKELSEVAKWIEQNRFILHGGCLATAYWRDLWPKGSSMSLEIWTLSQVRSSSATVRCRSSFQAQVVGLVPPPGHGPRPGVGAPGYFDLLTRLMEDPRTLEPNVDLGWLCGPYGIAPEHEWPERLRWMRALHPFPPPGF